MDSPLPGGLEIRPSDAVSSRMAAGYATNVSNNPTKTGSGHGHGSTQSAASSGSGGGGSGGLGLGLEDGVHGESSNRKTQQNFAGRKDVLHRPVHSGSGSGSGSSSGSGSGSGILSSKKHEHT